MGKPAAKKGDRIVGVDIHIVMIPAVPSPVPTPLPSPFTGIITDGCIESVKIMGMAAAVLGSTADNIPPHIPAGGPFQKPPTNKGKIMMGSATVLIGGKPAARMGDTAMTCNDPVDLPNGVVVAVSTVIIGG
ncbi:MAG: PAAR domain-containing protein [Thermomicrobiales bacterium]